MVGILEVVTSKIWFDSIESYDYGTEAYKYIQEFREREGNFNTFFQNIDLVNDLIYQIKNPVKMMNTP